ncbi:hypothetical protein H633G_09156 [Metarhizium anisopliae BRIP 53284]|nr:hypothetical protein H633G_09156 [Metarhizium anisopliae BRIP 53284]
MQRDAIIPLVDVDTIGRFGVAAFMGPERFDKQEIELVDEFSTVDKVLGKLGRATGRDLQTVYMTDEEIAEGSNLFVAGVLMMRGLTEEMERVLETYKQGDGVE